MGQSKKNSFKEACVNTAIGYLVTLAFSPFIYWCCGVKISGTKMNAVVICFTGLSVARSYVIRRWFNKAEVKGAHVGPCIPDVLEYKPAFFGGGYILINKCECGKVISQKRMK
jgi:hypothetical protein